MSHDLLVVGGSSKPLFPDSCCQSVGGHVVEFRCPQSGGGRVVEFRCPQSGGGRVVEVRCPQSGGGVMLLSSGVLSVEVGSCC